jgi:hypothetical protein
MRRGAGIGALQKRTQVQQRYESLGTELEAANEASVRLPKSVTCQPAELPFAALIHHNHGILYVQRR